jgi:hypothetical protein
MVAEWITDNEAGFDEWCKANPGGFIVNANYKPLAGYLVLHQVGCSSFKGRSGFTGPEYSKFCSNSVDALLAAIRSKAKAKAFSSICSTCRPLTRGQSAT